MTAETDAAVTGVSVEATTNLLIITLFNTQNADGHM
jgi:hypothetical protein